MLDSLFDFLQDSFYENVRGDNQDVSLLMETAIDTINYPSKDNLVELYSRMVSLDISSLDRRAKSKFRQFTKDVAGLL